MTLKNKYNEHDFLAACREGNVDVVQYFLDQGDFKVNEEFISGVSGMPVHGLFMAAQNGHSGVVKIVVKAGAELNQTWSGATPLYQAAQNQHSQVVRILVDAGAELNQAWEGLTPLFPAAQNGYSEVVQILVDAGVEVNQTWKGRTPLYQAAQNGHSEVVQILLNAGADPLITLRRFWFSNKSPLSVAKKNRPLYRRTNPAMYDRYTIITNLLKQATRKSKAFKQVTTHPPSEEVPLLGAFSALRLHHSSK
ncbi:ankyrin repeat domain-containing protein [Sansalvadorimonas verongulae]|uniref:ankyrin repeat domain-containing protein n=1 Tax=Sansalvadorimonas verongulae TaxID=2172824 RepID=UPI0012BBC89D|nr:ankyrin repeat domain-containing protein [Sansalvadorimonas verongulae]MTI12607.1 ankyrin repeat domain-containing protein [Sansalvadorimonas verongulae]